MATGTLNMSELSPGEAGGILAGIVTILITIGGGIRWLFGWSDSRAAIRDRKLKEWEESLLRRENELRERSEIELKEMREQLSVVKMVLFEAVGELQKLDPSSPILAASHLVLSKLYPIDTDTPDEIKALVRRLDTRKEG